MFSSSSLLHAVWRTKRDVLDGFLLFLPHFFPKQRKKILVDADSNQKINLLRKAIDSTEKFRPKTFVDNNYKQFQNNDNSVATSTKLFYFDPNTLEIRGWMRLGVSEKTATTILKYVSKGGKFRNPEDIRKIWSLRKNDADRIIPFVRIENNVVDYDKQLKYLKIHRQKLHLYKSEKGKAFSYFGTIAKRYLILSNCFYLLDYS